ncbi:hypothetical protein AKO1_005163 [Acrasis kona]|uniref:Uncharacterized protein n=1 Tax=Acrasis kona TaxID=1008807 RepID=A0AAW2Z682_9EUKA
MKLLVIGLVFFISLAVALKSDSTSLLRKEGSVIGTTNEDKKNVEIFNNAHKDCLSTCPQHLKDCSQACELLKTVDVSGGGKKWNLFQQLFNSKIGTDKNVALEFINKMREVPIQKRNEL